MYDGKKLVDEAEVAARFLTYRYESQLQQLTEEESKELAQSAMTRFKKHVNAGKMILKSSLQDEVLKAVSYVESDTGFFSRLFPRSKKFHHTEHRPQWTDHGIFQLSGLQVNGETAGSCQRFILPDSQPGIYGWRVGTIEEAEHPDYGWKPYVF